MDATALRFRLPDSAPEWEAILVAFLQRHLEVSGARGVVLGVSGGLDSAVVLGLCVRAFGPERVAAFLLPAADSDPLDAKHARLVCKKFGVEPQLISVAPIVEGFRATTFVAAAGSGAPPRARASAASRDMELRVVGNAKSRARMMVLYAQAQERGYLVCGTGNKSEILTGYFTKHGDGASDLQPIGDLYKGQVRELAEHLGVPKAILAKPPSAGLRPGQTDEDDMGVTYVQLDAVLKGIELNQDLDVIARRTGVELRLVRKVDKMVRSSEHKRHQALIPKVGARTVGLDWRRAVQWDG